MADWNAEADAPYIGKLVGQTPKIFNLTFTTDTGGYTAADVLADTQVMTDFFTRLNGNAIIDTITLLDEDDNTAAAYDIYFLDANSSLGTENSAPNISDTLARNILCRVPIAAADWGDIGTSKVASVNSLARIVKAASGTRDLYVGVINGAGTPTFAATGLKMRVGYRD